MKKFNIFDYKKLGVINMTPNSFSDGGINLNRFQLAANIREMLGHQNLILDIGFESTAPFNQPIDSLEERKRFDLFCLEFNAFKKIKVISIDSYKIENYQYFYQVLKSKNPKLTIIFNDVSGVVDTKLIDFLKKHPDSFYIYCSNKIKSRDSVLDHMKNLEKSENILWETRDNFNRIIALFKKNSLIEKLILDPGFGFSKSFEENWQLIDRVDELIADLNMPVLIGISKKSFLHRDITSPNKKDDSELIHHKLISDIQKNHKFGLLFRVHDPYIV